MRQPGKKIFTESHHCLPFNLRAWVEAADIYETGAVGALILWHWVKGVEAGLGPSGVAALGHMSESQAKRVLGRLKKRGWIVETQRRPGEKKGYRLTVDEMTFKQAHRWVKERLPQIRKDNKQLDLWEPETGSLRADDQAPQSRTYIIGDSSRDSSKDSGKAGGKAETEMDVEAKQRAEWEREFKAFTDYFWATYQEKHGVKPTPPQFKWLWDTLRDLVRTHGLEEMKKRADNYFADPYINTHPLQKFARENDTWAKKREKFGGDNGKFNQPGGQPWRPSGR